MTARELPIIRTFARNVDIIKLAVPVFLELILSVAMGYVNQFMLAGIPLASNAVGQANQISQIFIVTFSVLSNSSLILITQLRGKGNESAIKDIYPLAFYFNLAIGILVAAINIGIAPAGVFSLMGVDKEVIPYAINYQMVSGISLAFLALNNVFSAFLRGNKKMVQPTIIAFAMNGVAACANAVAIWGIPGLDEMGKTIGVAISTDLSRLIGLALSMFFFYRVVHESLSPKRLFPLRKDLLKKMTLIGLPTAGETLSYNFSQLVLVIIVNLSVSVLMQNLRSYLITFTSIIYLFANGTGIAMQVVEGNLIGEGKKDEADRLVRDIGTMARTVSLIMSLIITAIAYWVFSALMTSAVNNPETNPDGIGMGTVALTAVFCMLIDIVLDQGRATNLVYVKGLETAGDIMFPVLSSIITSWVFTVGLSALLCLVANLGIYGAFIGACLDECVRGLAYMIRWQRGGWRKRTLTKDIA